MKVNVRKIGCEDETGCGANPTTEFCISNDESLGLLPEIYFVCSVIKTLWSLRLLLEMDTRSLNHVPILYAVRTI